MFPQHKVAHAADIANAPTRPNLIGYKLHMSLYNVFEI